MTGPAALWVEMRDITRQLHCDCYDPDEMEYDPGRVCPRCQLLDMLEEKLGEAGVPSGAASYDYWTDSEAQPDPYPGRRTP